MKKKLILLITLAGLLALAGCAAKDKENKNRENEIMSEEVTKMPEATATTAPTATSTPTPEPTATSTPTPEPTATSTPTPEPTATTEPTVTMAPTATTEPTVTMAPTEKAEETPVPEVTEAADEQVSSDNVEEAGLLQSPFVWIGGISILLIILLLIYHFLKKNK